MTLPNKKLLAVSVLGFFLLSLNFLSVSSIQAQSGKKININTASAAELETLPRIGPAVAQRIIDYREKNGKFNRIEDIMKVPGIGEKVFEQIKDKITVGN